MKYGIYVSISHNLTVVEDNIITGLQRDYSRGISMNSVSNTIIQNNIITSFSDLTDGVRLDFCDNINVRDNNFDEGGDIAIHLRDSENNTISENSITESRSAGVKFDRSHNNSILENRISQSEYSGIAFYSSRSNEVLNNSLYKNDVGFNVAPEPSVTTTRYNNIYNNNFIKTVGKL